MRLTLLMCLIGCANISNASNICHKCKPSCHNKCEIHSAPTNVKVVAENKIINNIKLLPSMPPLNIEMPMPQPQIQLPAIRQFNFVSNIQSLSAKADNYVSPFVKAAATNRAYSNAYISQQIIIENKAILKSNACQIIKSKSYHH